MPDPPHQVKPRRPLARLPAAAGMSQIWQSRLTHSTPCTYSFRDSSEEPLAKICANPPPVENQRFATQKSPIWHVTG